MNTVFLICSERSGSNLVCTMLNAHNSIYAPPPYHLGRDIGLNLHATLDPNLKSDSWKTVIKALNRRITKLQSKKEALLFKSWLAEQSEVRYTDLMNFLYLENEHAKDASIVIIKENNVHKMLFFLLLHFPDAKFVFQVRDPRDYLVSATQRKAGWMKNKFGSNLRAMEIWRDDQLGGLNALAHLGRERVFIQRYEDLISQPETVLRALSKFLALPFDPAVLEFHKTQNAAKLAVPGGPRENLNKPLLSSNFGKFREMLTKEHILMVETYLGDLMARFGYEKEYPNEEADLNSIMLPQLSETLERYINGEVTPFYRSSENLEIPGKALCFEYHEE